MIGRTNFNVFQEVVNLICTPSNPPKASYKIDANFLDTLQDLHFLYTNQKWKMKKFKKFPNFAKFEAFAKNTNDNELMGKVKIVKEYPKELPEILQKIKVRCHCPENLADYVFTTTHKAKGLEWKTVILLNDFIEVTNGIMSDRTKSGDEAEDEENILYVAMTRAKEYLVIFSFFFKFFFI